MVQLEGAKCSFLLCLGTCIVICSVIYLSARTPTYPQGPSTTAPAGCRPFSQLCQAVLPTPLTAPGTTWARRDCQVEGYLQMMVGDKDRATGGSLDCSLLTRELHFITQPLSREEEDYPLAFILTVHKELELFVRLLRSIYAPQNLYCVHVDAKAPSHYRIAVATLLGCLPNVFLSSRSETVTYAGFSRLQADINCMRDLVGSPVGWMKVINLCGQDFPVKTNLELVRYLQSPAWRDRNMTPGIKQPPAMRHRTQLQHREVRGSHVVPRGKGLRKRPPPRGLEVYFGTAYYALTRGFVKFVLESPTARDLLHWSRDTFSPDEHFWVTLNHIPEAPGSHVMGGWDGEIRAIKWRDQEGTAHNGCKGRYVRDICIYGLEDLDWIIQRNSMFANKFESRTFPEALDCLEQWHRDKVLRQATVPIQSSWLLATLKQANAAAATSRNSSSSLFNATLGF